MEEKTICLKALGKNVKKYRLANQLTQENLANSTNLSIQYIGNIERGYSTPSIETIMKISLALNITPNHLLLPSLVPKPDTLKEQIANSLPVDNVKFLRHILQYIEFLKDSKYF
ncbi:helix-turn-helix transcriptional regulator [Clostridiaceae bacterium M8S5]|nr:helix-turn-helix transcriptional regulator [Clostridiaceae bacterium M8S5]